MGRDRSNNAISDFIEFVKRYLTLILPSSISTFVGEVRGGLHLSEPACARSAAPSHLRPCCSDTCAASRSHRRPLLRHSGAWVVATGPSSPFFLLEPCECSLF